MFIQREKAYNNDKWYDSFVGIIQYVPDNVHVFATDPVNDCKFIRKKDPILL